MNTYGQLARTHWVEWLPNRYATIKNPDEFFTMLGTEIEAEIETRYRARMTTQPHGLSPSEAEGWAAMARSMVTSEVMDELAYLTPEPDLDDEDLPADPLSPGSIAIEAFNEAERLADEEEFAEQLREWRERQANPN